MGSFVSVHFQIFCIGFNFLKFSFVFCLLFPFWNTSLTHLLGHYIFLYSIHSFIHSFFWLTFLSPFLAPLLLSAVNFGVYQDFSSIQIHFQVNAFCPMILNTTYFMITLKLICPAWTSSLNCRSRYLTFNLLSVIECLTGGLSLISKMNS